MASKNSIKNYAEDSFYHLYNRGVEKRDIFLNQQDYSVFLSYLKEYLLPKNETELKLILSSLTTSPEQKNKALRSLQLKNYSQNVELVCYTLMPNHFHLLIKQNANALDSFMNSLGTRYAMYFNRKNKRTGVLFQDVYKAVCIETDEQLLHLSRYIHLNPIKSSNLTPNNWQEVSQPTSLPEYLHKRETAWIKTDYILDYFSRTNKNNTYENFLGMTETPEDELLISQISLDEE